MIFLQALLAFIVNSAGKILNTAFGWAMVVLFGKVPANKQFLLSLISLTSILWLLTVLGLVFPRAGAWMISLVPVSRFIDVTPIRLAMVPGVLFLPALVGYWSLLLTEKKRRPTLRKEVCCEILRGYPFAVALSLTFIVMLTVVPILKVLDLIHRMATEHIPVMIKPKGYSEVAAQIIDMLKKHGVQAEISKAPWVVRYPTKLLSRLSSNVMNACIADELVQLKWATGAILIHPSDLVVRGRPRLVAQVHAWIVSELSLTSAYFTWHEEAHQIEDELRAINESTTPSLDEAGVRQIGERLAGVEEKMRRLSIPQEEWDVLYREFLQMKCNFLEAEHLAGNCALTLKQVSEKRQPKSGELRA